MTKPDSNGQAPSRHAGAHGCGSTNRPLGDGADPDHELLPVLTFLRHEIDQSAALLSDLAKCLSHALCTLTTASEPDTRQSSLSDAAIALQQEDRVQQRLRDLKATVAVLEGALDGTSPHRGADLDRAIIASLRLEETRHNFAAATGMAEAFVPQSPTPNKPPPIGDIDLF